MPYTKKTKKQKLDDEIQVRRDVFDWYKAKFEKLARNEDFKTIVKRIRNEFDIPNGGFSNTKVDGGNKVLQWRARLNEQSYETLHGDEFRKNLIGLRKLHKSGDLTCDEYAARKKQLHEESIGINRWKRSIDEIITSFNLGDNFRRTAETYLITGEKLPPMQTYTSRVIYDKQWRRKAVIEFHDKPRDAEWEYIRKDAIGYLYAKSKYKRIKQNLDRDLAFYDLSQKKKAHETHWSLVAHMYPQSKDPNLKENLRKGLSRLKPGIERHPPIHGR